MTRNATSTTRPEQLYISALHIISPTPGTLARIGREVVRILREQGHERDDHVREVLLRVVSS